MEEFRSYLPDAVILSNLSETAGRLAHITEQERAHIAELAAEILSGIQQPADLLASLPDRTLADAPTPAEQALAVGYLLQIFYLMNGAIPVSDSKKHRLPANVIEIQAYLDSHFAEIQSVADVAQQLYYSREYLSRIFKKYYNTTVADYIRQRRVAYSQELIAAGTPISKACYQAGFENMSSFIRAFHRIANLTPSAYQQSVRPD